MIQSAQNLAYQFWSLERGLVYPAISADGRISILTFIYEEGWEPNAEESDVLKKIAFAVGFSNFELGRNQHSENKNTIFLTEHDTTQLNAIFHPRLLLKNPQLKKIAWEKLKKCFKPL